jgi:hypothetical protein
LPYAGALPAVFLAAAAGPATAAPGDIRKADQSAIGVSQVTIPKVGKGAPGASIPDVPLDVSGFKGKTAVIGPNGAEGGSIKNKSRTSGFFAGGELEDEKAKLMGKKPFS